MLAGSSIEFENNGGTIMQCVEWLCFDLGIIYRVDTKLFLLIVKHLATADQTVYWLSY